MRAAMGLLLVVVIAVVALNYGNVSDRMLPRVDLPEDSDYYMRNAVVRQMSATGELEYRMDVAESLHYPDDTARLSNIDVHYLGGEEDPEKPASGEWKLHADKGHIPATQEEIFLSDNVQATMKRKDGEDVRIDTDKVWVRSAQKLIETESPVTARSLGRTIRGTGMTVFLEEDRLKLHNDVRVSYEP